MPLKHIKDYEIQLMVDKEINNPEFEAHLKECPQCKASYDFYTSMFAKLSTRSFEGFSPNFALEAVKEVTRIKERTQRWKLNLFILLVLISSTIPFVLFPSTLENVEVLGSSAAHFFSYIIAFFRKHNISSLPLIAAVLLIIIIHFLDVFSRRHLRKKNLR